MFGNSHGNFQLYRFITNKNIAKTFRGATFFDSHCRISKKTGPFLNLAPDKEMYCGTPFYVITHELHTFKNMVNFWPILYFVLHSAHTLI